MAYFLKVAKQQNRTYLSIYESFYSPDVKGTKHRSVKKIGNVLCLPIKYLVKSTQCDIGFLFATIYSLISSLFIITTSL